MSEFGARVSSVVVSATAVSLFCACASTAGTSEETSLEGTVGSSGKTLCLGLGDLMIVGTAFDEATREAVDGVSIHVEGTELRVLTDAAGSYRILPVARSYHTLQAVKAGYYREQRQVGRLDSDVLRSCAAKPTDTLRLDFYMRINPDFPPQ